MNFKFNSSVIVGIGAGKRLGFPTLNFVIPKIFPLAPGSYACQLTLEAGAEAPDAEIKLFRGVLFFGTRETFGIAEPTLEVHVFDFPEGLRVTSVQIEVGAKIREPQKFASEAELIAAIENDCQLAKMI